jgi:DNA-binding transcriptional regulator YhcF (GntR family)
MADILMCTEKRLSKWQQIYNRLQKDIITGKYADKSDFFTLKGLCQKFNVSNITAQRIFKELKQAGLIATTGRRGTIVTNSKKTNRILLCLFKSDDPTNDPFKIDASYKYSEGFLTAKADTPFEIYPISEGFLWDNLNDIEDDVVMASGILLAIDKNSVQFDKKRAEILRDKINPVIIHSFSGLEGFPQVGIDYYKGFYNATTYLLKKGHRKISFLMTSSNVWHAPRLKGYMDALEHNGCIYDNDLTKLVPSDNTNDDWSIINNLLQSKSPSAVICSSDHLALRIHAVCKKHGVKIPGDIALMGFDNIGESKLVKPGLTTMDSHLEKFGEAAISLLERRRSGFDIKDENIQITPSLIVRETI